MSTLAAAKVNRVELHYPRHGTAWAKVSTVDAVVPAGPAILTIRDLVLVGAVLPSRGGEDSPSSWTGVWVQGAGWDTVLPTRPPYQNDSGVRLKTILTDLATDCGVSAALPADAPMGTHWSRATRGGDGKARTGRDELAALIKRGSVPAWWVDALNVTRFTARTSGPIKAAARVTSRDLTRGRRTLGVDTLAAFVPGGTFEGVTVERLVIREESENLTVETWES